MQPAGSRAECGAASSWTTVNGPGHHQRSPAWTAPEEDRRRPSRPAILNSATRRGVGDELGQVADADADRVGGDANMPELARLAELVDRRRGGLQPGGHLLHCQERRRNDLGSQQRGGCQSRRLHGNCMGSRAGAYNFMQSLGGTRRPNPLPRQELASACIAVQTRRARLGCKWSLVQIQSPRPSRSTKPLDSHAKASDRGLPFVMASPEKAG